MSGGDGAAPVGRPARVVKQGLSNLQLRILSGAVLAAVALGVTWAGGLPFRVFAAAAAAAIFFEWCSMTRNAADRRHQLFSAALFAIVLVALIAGWASPLLLVLALTVLCVAAGFFFGRWGWTAAGFAYAGLSGAALAGLRGDGREGLFAILLLFAVVWATDIMAYAVGRLVGGPKLAPGISPGKTWSGAAGGAVAGLVLGTALAYEVGVAHPLAFGAVALVLSAVSQAGDLFESWVKRRHGVKDSGWLIPGHGGVMDRADGLVAAGFALYAAGLLLGRGSDAAAWLFAG